MTRPDEVSPEEKNAVDTKLMELYAENDPETLGKIMVILVTDPLYYQGLAKIKDLPPAVMEAYVTGMIQKALPPGGGDEGLTADSELTPDEAEKMLMECKDRWGTELLRLEEAGIISVAICNGIKRTTAGVTLGAAAASTVVLRASVQAMNRAMILTFVSEVSQAASIVSRNSGNVVESIFFSLLSGEAEASATVSQQVALRMQTASTVCKYASRAGLVLSVGLLGYELYSEVRKYWKGEIDGYTCAQNLTTSFSSAAAGFAGGAGAIALCAGAGPWGLLFAGVAGALMASGLTTMAVKAAFEGIFGTDRERALKKAYEELGLKEGASDHAVRQSYLDLAKRMHPDKGGDKEKFIKINSAYELIRASKLAS